MSVSSEITRLYGVRSDIFDAITAKGVSVPQGSVLDDAPDLIGQISGGSPTPPVLPANTLRLQFFAGYTPTFEHGSGTQVSSSPNVWDWTYNSASWTEGLRNQTMLRKVLAAGDTSAVTNMSHLFYKCTALTEVSLFDTSSVTSMTSMFDNCGALPEVPLFNTGSVTRMDYMFNFCKSLVTTPVFDTSSVERMDSMFYYCDKLTSVPLFNTASVTSTASMFQSCSALTSVPLLNTSNVTNMNNMFYNCSALTSVPLLPTDSATNVSSMFYNTKLVQSGALALYQQMSSQTTPPSSHTSTFKNCGSNTTSGAAELAQIPSKWK